MEQEKTYKWIQARLRDLHAGTLSAEDHAHLLEMAKDDPFVSDALDGYNAHAQHDHKIYLHTISHRIRNRGAANRRRFLPTRHHTILQAVAASLVLIFVTWAVIYYAQKDTSSTLATMTVEEQMQNDNSESISSAGDDVQSKTTPVSPELAEEPQGLRATAQSKAREAGASRESATTSQADNANPTRQTNPYEIPQDVAATSVPPGTSGKTTSTANEGYFANQMSPAMMAMRTKGQVMDVYGQPVTGAILSIPSSNLLTTSDLHGRFELYVPDSVSTLEVSSTGYEEAIVPIESGNMDIVVMLKPGNSPAVKLNQPESAAADSKSSIHRSAPAHIHDYIRSNARFTISDQISDKYVTVQFRIEANGKPFEVHSIQTTADKKFVNETIRLITNGPLWNCESAYPCTKQYTIYFR